MLWRWRLISSCLTLLYMCPGRALCPTSCSCRLDEKGLRKVSCLHGEMQNPIPTGAMDAGMEVLEISAPETKWNQLTLGPIFQKFKNLVEIHITRCSVVQIGMHAFWGVPTLKVLNLMFNNISVVFDHNFRGLANLVELNLNDNCIGRLPIGAFRHLTELSVLTLERNRIEELVPRLFVKLGKLHVLKLSGNPLQELNPEVFKDVLELRVLECRGCGLRRINTQIYHLLPYLTHLDLGNNQMQFISSDEFHDLHRLRSLMLDGNKLPVVLEKTFTSQVQLRTLCLARNRLAKITNTAFLNLSNLIELDISYNKLSKIEVVALQPIANTLKKLVISGNQFSLAVIRVMLQVTAKVSELALADMGIIEIPPGHLLERLKSLNLSGNNCTRLDVQVLPQQLVELDLSRNKFRGLEERVIVRLQQMRRLNLEDNPWACELCHIGAMLSRTNRSAALQNLICASPKSLERRVFSSLQPEEVIACDTGSDSSGTSLLFAGEGKLVLLIGGACLFIFLLVCVIFVVYSCSRRRINNAVQEVKRAREREAIFENSAALFGDKGEISFKFPLDLTERKVSVSTIDDMKKETQLHTLPNGTGI